jgi:hypothetical protein
MFTVSNSDTEKARNMEKTYVWTGIDAHGNSITKTVTAQVCELSPEERIALDVQTQRDIARLCSYALSNPEVLVH